VISEVNPSELVKCSSDNICLVIIFFVKCLATSCVGSVDILQKSFDKVNVFTAALNKLTGIHFTNHSNFTSLLFYLSIVLTIQQTSFY